VNYYGSIVLLRLPLTRCKPNLLGLIFLLCVAACPLLARAEYRANLWAADDGLPQGAFRGMAQTSDGYLWISTLDGLARFDGVNFTLFNRGNTQGIESSRFTALHKGVGGDLWLVSEAGVTRYHDRTFKTVLNPRAKYDSIVFSMSSDESGHIWIQLKDRILQWNEQAGQFVDITPADMRMPYSAMYWEGGGAWSSKAGRLYVFRRGRFHIYPLPPVLLKKGIHQVATDSEGTIWIESTDGTYVSMRDGEFVQHSGEVVSHFEDTNGNVWPIRLGPHLTRSVSYLSTNGNVSLPFNLMFEDHEGTLWFAMDGVGLYQMQEQLVRTLSTKQGLAAGDVYSLLQDRSGSIWIGAWPGLFRYEKGTFTDFSLKRPVTDLVNTLFEDAAGDLWVGSRGSLRVMRDGKLRDLPPGLELPKPIAVQTVYEDRDGTLWIGTNGGLYSYREGKTSLYGAKNGLPTRDVNVIMQSSSGSLWIGGYRCLAQYENGHFTVEGGGHEELTTGAVWSLYEDHEGILWIGTYDAGLLRWENGHITKFNTRNGLFDNGILQILEDTRGNLWISSHRGIFRVKKQELNDVAAGKLINITSIAYGKRDGMLNIECNGGVSPAGIKTRAGTMWFPTQNGIAVLDPDNASAAPPVPKVVIESVTVDQIQSSNVSSIRIAPDQHGLEVDYTAPSFIKSDQISFRYRLVGADSDWTDAGTKRRLYFSHLQPGKYVLQVVAANSDGVWNPEPGSLNIQVLAPFYRTSWFYASLLLLATMLTIVMWRRRVAQLLQAEIQHRTFSQQLIASQESERKRIAAELHDSIGQRLIIINNLAQMSLSPQNNGSENTMQEISTEAMAALDETRQISYDLRPFQLDRLGLAKAIRALANRASAAGRFKVTVELDDIDDAFPEELRINFYRIVQEALNNILKHAEATAVLIQVTRLPKRVTLTIQDNGIGFAAERRGETAGPGGFGTTGMTERAALLGGTVVTESALNNGTTIVAEFATDREPKSGSAD
jgi:signal transduction histidine kinase/ligand-binding sensor domain-containing protein